MTSTLSALKYIQEWKNGIQESGEIITRTDTEVDKFKSSLEIISKDDKIDEGLRKDLENAKNKLIDAYRKYKSNKDSDDDKKDLFSARSNFKKAAEAIKIKERFFSTGTEGNFRECYFVEPPFCVPRERYYYVPRC
jgi:hypothetical protein